jgi:ribosomal protein L7/L12
MGCVLTKGDKDWHRIISDPRKNMLIDLKNESDEEEQKDFTIVLEDKTKVKIGTVKEGSSVIGIKEY